MLAAAIPTMLGRPWWLSAMDAAKRVQPSVLNGHTQRREDIPPAEEASATLRLLAKRNQKGLPADEDLPRRIRAEEVIAVRFYQRGRVWSRQKDRHVITCAGAGMYSKP